MEPQAVPFQLLDPAPLPPRRRKAVNSDTFWSLMDRWKVSEDRALSLIGHNDAGSNWVRRERPRFALSDQQAQVVSCLLEIDLTLTVAGVGEDQLHRRIAQPSTCGESPLGALGRCDPRRAAAVLWCLNQSVRGLRCPRKPRPSKTTGKRRMGQLSEQMDRF
jgi:hypothetical protein